jgi:hypothetical protein
LLIRDNAVDIILAERSNGFFMYLFIHCFYVSNARKGKTIVVTAQSDSSTRSAVNGISAAAFGSVRASSIAASKAHIG